MTSRSDVALFIGRHVRILGGPQNTRYVITARDTRHAWLRLVGVKNADTFRVEITKLEVA